MPCLLLLVLVLFGETSLGRATAAPGSFGRLVDPPSAIGAVPHHPDRVVPFPRPRTLTAPNGLSGNTHVGQHSSALATPLSEAAGGSKAFTDRLTDGLARLGRAAPLAFIAFFVVNTVLCLPTALTSLAGGFLFGAGWGMAYVWTGAMLGASAAFAISRNMGQTWIQRRIARRPVLLAIEQAVSEEGWKIVFLSRLAPGSPFFLLNYLFGLTRIGFFEYFWATAISVIPGSFLLVYLGSVGHRAVSGRIRSPAEWALYGVGVAALGIGAWLIGRRAHRILNRKLGTRPPPLNGTNPPPPT